MIFATNITLENYQLPLRLDKEELVNPNNARLSNNHYLINILNASSSMLKKIDFDELNWDMTRRTIVKVGTNLIHNFMKI